MKYNNEVLSDFFIKLVKENTACKVIINKHHSFVIYKGFKIEREFNSETSLLEHTMTDLRYNDITTYVKPHEFNRMLEQGVVKAIDLISADHNTKLIRGLQEDLKSYIKMLDEDNNINKNYIISKIEELSNEISAKENAIKRTNKLYKNGK